MPYCGTYAADAARCLPEAESNFFSTELLDFVFVHHTLIMMPSETGLCQRFLERGTFTRR